MSGIRDDLRYAFRRLRLQPGFTVVAVLVLALGLGANTAIFTLIHAVMLRPLPVRAPAELLRLGTTDDCCVNGGLQREFSLFSYPLFEQFRDHLDAFTDLAGFQAGGSTTGIRPADGGPARSLRSTWVTANYFRMLGVRPEAGRLLEPGDDAPGAPPVFVMSHRAWTDQYGADPAVIGTTFYVDGTAATLVGITDPSFFGETIRPNPSALWLPIGQEPIIRGASSLLARPDQHWLYAIGRLKPGVSADAVSANATQVLRSWLEAQTFVSDRERALIPEQHVPVVSAVSGVQIMRANFGSSLTLLFAMSGLVLLITAANLANLLLARADRGQAAIRAALGASRRRLMRQSMMEGLLLAALGGAGSFVVSALATRLILTTMFPTAALQAIDLTPSPAIVLFSAALALVTAVLFSAAPALAMARTAPMDALRGAGRDGRDVAFMPRRSLVIVQVTLSLVLLSGAGVLTRSLTHLIGQPLGFETADRLVVHVDTPQIADQPERLAAMYARLGERLRQIPGVRRASWSLYSPMEGNNWSSYITIAGRPVDPENRDGSSWNRVGPDYFETMGTRVIQGRGITASDGPDAPLVAVVNAAFVARYFPDASPLGARLGIGGASHANDFQIVGVTEDVKYTDVSAPTRPMIFLPIVQRAQYGDETSRQVHVRSTLAGAIELQVAPGTGSLEPQIRRTLSEVDPDLIVTRILPMTEQVAGNFTLDRLLAGLTLAYGGLALVLAAIGLYGVTAYGVARRRQEIGVRMALGASRGRILWMIVRGAIAQTTIGLAIGLAVALAAAGVLSARLYEVQARDPVVIALAAAALLVTSVAAAIWPARRAATVEPTGALRSQ
ncbi:MAG: ABC transporter permease [Vicinamibacterales bacterium]